MSDIKRRAFISLLGGAAVAWPLAARAQQPATNRRAGKHVGKTRNRVCRAQFGWSDGRNVAIDRIMAHPLWRLHRGVDIT